MAAYGGEGYIVSCTTLVSTDDYGKEMEMIAVLFKEIQHNNEKTLHSGHSGHDLVCRLGSSYLDDMRTSSR